MFNYFIYGKHFIKNNNHNSTKRAFIYAQKKIINLQFLKKKKIPKYSKNDKYELTRLGHRFSAHLAINRRY